MYKYLVAIVIALTCSHTYGGILELIISGANLLYNIIPDAEYIIEYKLEGTVGTDVCQSADVALQKAKEHLLNGAEYATINSTHMTVHPSCRNKTYRRNDINKLEKHLRSNNISINPNLLIENLYKHYPGANYIIAAFDEIGDIVITTSEERHVSALMLAYYYLQSSYKLKGKYSSYVMVISRNKEIWVYNELGAIMADVKKFK